MQPFHLSSQYFSLDSLSIIPASAWVVYCFRSRTLVQCGGGRDLRSTDVRSMGEQRLGTSARTLGECSENVDSVQTMR